MGSAYLRTEPLRRLGRHVLVELTQRTGETSHLAVLHGTEVLYIDKEEPSGSAPRLVTEIGVRLPAHLTAVGRAVLAQLPAAQVSALFANQPLVQRTGRGPSNMNALLSDLQEVRRAGYAFDDQLVTPGIACLARPVFSHNGVPVAALGLTFIAAQRSPDDVQLAASLVREMSVRLSSTLGYSDDATAESNGVDEFHPADVSIAAADRSRRSRAVPTTSGTESSTRPQSQHLEECARVSTI